MLCAPSHLVYGMIGVQFIFRLFDTEWLFPQVCHHLEGSPCVVPASLHVIQWASYGNTSSNVINQRSNLNPKKFVTCSSIIVLGYIVSKEGKMPDPKKVATLMSKPTPINPHDIQVFNSIAQLYWCFIENFAFVMPATKLMRQLDKFLWTP
jgi:hypothetical protein